MVLCLCGMTAFALHLGFCALLFASEPPGPSRRVRIHWERARTGRWRRFFGPGLSKTALLVAFLGVAGICSIAFIDAFIIQTFPTSVPSYAAYGSAASRPSIYVQQILIFGSYLAPFFLFVVALTAWLRSRNHTPWVARLITLAVLFLTAAGPWVVAAIGGVLSSHHDDDWLMVASPSPFYVFAMLKAVDRTDPTPIIPVGLACALIWGVVGVWLLASTARRCAHTVAQHDAAVAQAEAALRAEEEATASPGTT